MTINVSQKHIETQREQKKELKERKKNEVCACMCVYCVCVGPWCLGVCCSMGLGVPACVCVSVKGERRGGVGVSLACVLPVVEWVQSIGGP